MSVSAVGGPAGYPAPAPTKPPVKAEPALAPQAVAPKAVDADHDGDRDVPGQVDVRA